MEHDPKKICCFICDLTKEQKKLLKENTGRTSICFRCPCHTQTTPSEEWERKFDEILEKAFEPNQAIQFQMTDNFDGIERDHTEYVKDFIRDTRTESYRKGVRDSLEVIPEKWEHTHETNYDKVSHHNLALEKAHDAISTLLT